MIKAIITSICLGLLACCALLPPAGNHDADAIAARLTNADVVWDGNFIGLQPTIKGLPARQLLGLGKQASPALRRSLSDPGKFAAAHVLLTQIEKKEYQVSASHWNNLEVDLHADGSVDLHPDQIEKIKVVWKKEPNGS